MGASNFLNNLKFKADENKPEIMLVAGLVGVVAATVLACRATLKAKDIIDEHNAEMDLVNSDEVNKEDPDNKKQLAKLYLKTGFKVAKVYAPALAIEAAAFALLIKSNGIQRNRYAALTAAYISVDQAFKKYREAVIAELGPDKDLEFRGLKREQIEVKSVDADGNEIVEKKDSYTYCNEANAYISEYAKFFDEGCPDWTKNPENNLLFLRLQESAANDKLKIQGHLFLNEVYDMLGIPRTTAGQVVGWRYIPDNPHGDNYVKFDIYNINREANRNFVNGYERSVLLDFNVDGPIYEAI